MTLALAACGGASALARRLGVDRRAVKWRRCPQVWVLRVARAASVPAEAIRPDLAGWIERERERELAERRRRFSLVKVAPAAADVDPRAETVALIDKGVIMEAMAFAAAHRKQLLHDVWRGRSREALGAWALGMALAHVVGRVSSTTIGECLGTSRQNIDNAAERYLRARDGDDPDDAFATATGPRVIERGRVRRLKSACDDLWALEQAFDAAIHGEARRA